LKNKTAQENAGMPNGNDKTPRRYDFPDLLKFNEPNSQRFANQIHQILTQKTNEPP
jgi:hypothetical protein